MRLVFDVLLYPASFLQQCLNCIVVAAYTLLLEQKLWFYTRANQKTALFYRSPNLFLTILMDRDIALCSLRRKARLQEEATYRRDKTKLGFVSTAAARNANDVPHSLLAASRGKSSQPLPKVF